MRGANSTEVTLVEYGDYECERSGQAYRLIRDNWQEIGARVHFVFRNFPISQIHPQAQHAAEAAEAAGGQNKFWEMHDILFEHQSALENGFILEYASVLGLDTMRFLKDMAMHNYSDRVRDDFQSGLKSGVNSTPTFFINGMRYDEMWDVQALLKAVEAAAVVQAE